MFGHNETADSMGGAYYLSLDDYIDTERLRSLNDGLEAKLLELLEDDPARIGLFSAGERLDPTGASLNGTRTVRLRNQIRGGYSEIHCTDSWDDSESAAEFPELMSFVASLPLTSFGRCFIIFDNGGVAEPPHRDHGDPTLKQEFIWVRTNLRKRFYIYEKSSGQKHHVESYSAWFDTRHFHGVDPVDGLSLSIRVDGVFSDEFRKAIELSQQNLVQPKGYTLWEKITRKYKASFGRR